MAESRRAQFEAKFADSAQYTPMVHAQVDEFLNATAGAGAALRMAKTDIKKLFRLDDLVEADEESEGAEHVYVDYNELAADENLEQKERRLARFFRIQIVETMVALLGTERMQDDLNALLEQSAEFEALSSITTFDECKKVLVARVRAWIKASGMPAQAQAAQAPAAQGAAAQGQGAAAVMVATSSNTRLPPIPKGLDGLTAARVRVGTLPGRERGTRGYSVVS